MPTLASPSSRVKPSRVRKPVVLTDTPRHVTIRQAHRFCREADYVALAVPMGGLRQQLVDISKTQARKVLRGMGRRFARVPLADLFGTIVIGEQ